MKKAIATLVLAVGALSLSGCQLGANNFDLEGVEGIEPDRIEVVLNVDRFPNVVRMCLDGFAYSMVSADQQAPYAHDRLVRHEEWDVTFCGGGQ